jgi:hypothetical protein
MKTELSADALEFEGHVRNAMSRSGGAEHVVRAQNDPNYRLSLGELLGDLGIWELAPLDDLLQLEAAALSCYVAGQFALPYPVAERIAGTSDGQQAVVVVDHTNPRIAHADLDLEWIALDVSGKGFHVREVRPSVGGKLGQFVHPVELGASSDSQHHSSLVLLLQSWTLLGMLESTQRLTCKHVSERQQFGQPLAEFQGVRFSIADMSVSTQALRELAKYTLWSVFHARNTVVSDTLSLRSASLEAADFIFRVGHQLHGAIGFCDESELSWLSRYSQRIRQLPFGRAATEQHLIEAIRREGYYSPIRTLEGRSA